MELDIKKRRIIEEIKALPTLPVIMLKILECIDDTHSSAMDLKNIIIKDIAISSKVLSLSNSAYYGYHKDILDITRSIVVLGFETIIDVALSVSLGSLLSPSKNNIIIPLSDLWEHSIAAGEAGRLCAKEKLYPYQERAFLIGLMHDIGKIALYRFFPDEFNTAVKKALDNNKFISITEKNELGFTHYDAGVWLVEKWNLPPAISVPICFHHNPQDAPIEFQKEALLVHLADYLVKYSKIGDSGDNNKLPELSPLVYSIFKTNEEKINDIAQKLEELKPKIISFIESVF